MEGGNASPQTPFRTPRMGLIPRYPSVLPARRAAVHTWSATPPLVQEVHPVKIEDHTWKGEGAEEYHVQEVLFCA